MYDKETKYIIQTRKIRFTLRRIITDDERV